MSCQTLSKRRLRGTKGNSQAHVGWDPLGLDGREVGANDFTVRVVVAEITARDVRGHQDRIDESLHAPQTSASADVECFLQRDGGSSSALPSHVAMSEVRDPTSILSGSGARYSLSSKASVKIWCLAEQRQASFLMALLTTILK